MSNLTTIQQSSQPVTIQSLLGKDSVRARLNDILGKRAAGFSSSIISVANSSQLIGSDPTTILGAAMVAATMDLPINPNLGFAYIVPYNSKQGKQAQFQLGYKGIIQLAQRSGQYQTINATEVREGELISNDILTGRIVIKPLEGDRTKANIIGYAAYFELVNGFSKTLYMTKEEMDTHAKRYSQSYRNDRYNSSLWSQQFDLMAKKTVLKLLISKYGPLSIDMQMAQQADQSVVKTNDANPETFEYVDNQDFVEVQDIEDTPADIASARAAATEAAASQFDKQK